MNKHITYKKSLQPRWLNEIQQNRKVVEGRINSGDWKNMKVGDYIEFYDNLNNKCLVQITYKTNYKNFNDLISSEQLIRVLPGTNINEKIYDIIYEKRKNDIENDGVIAIGIKLIY